MTETPGIPVYPATWEGRTPTREQLAEILEKHAQWRRSEQAEGARAYLSGAYLSGADLSRADLSSAYLSGAYLSGAYLSRADLSSAYLSGAYLSRADLRGAYLSGADLRGAYLSGADLRGAYLSGADGILIAGPCDQYLLYVVRHDDGPRIQAGCRWFTRAEAAEHWSAPEMERHHQGKDHGARMLACVNALVTLARVLGWPGCES